jgi:hypothetical protein
MMRFWLLVAGQSRSKTFAASRVPTTMRSRSTRPI